MSIHMRDQKRVCDDCGTPLQFGSACYFCPACGWGKCGRVIETGAAFLVTLAVLAVVVLA